MSAGILSAGILSIGFCPLGFCHGTAFLPVKTLTLYLLTDTIVLYDVIIHESIPPRNGSLIDLSVGPGRGGDNGLTSV